MAAYRYLPMPDSDNGPALNALIANGERWIQIAGEECPIGTTVHLVSASGSPAHGITIEPAPGISRVKINVSAIGRDPITPTNPSFAGFDYSGNERPAGFLTKAAAPGDFTVSVNDGALYSLRDWVFLSQASTDPANYLLPLDGPMEVRQIVAIDSNVLTLNRPLILGFALNTIACICEPLYNARFRDLCFIGNATVGLHMHLAHSCTYTRISSEAWSGGVMLLVDNGGTANMIVDCFCTGIKPGAGLMDNIWGVAIEGQDGTKVYSSGGMRCGNGIIANYCINTQILEPIAYSNNVNVTVGFKSINTDVIRPFTAEPVQHDYIVSNDCVNCQVSDPQIYQSSDSEPPFSNIQLPVAVAPDSTDRFLITRRSGSTAQLPSSSLIIRAPDGAVEGDRFEIRSTTNYSGNFRATNTLRSWLTGMLGAVGSQDYTIVDLTAGITRFNISGNTGAVSYGGDLNPFQGGVFDVGAASTPWRDIYANRHLRAGNGVIVAGVQVLREQRAARPDLPVNASLAEVIAKVNGILADERSMGLRAS